MMPTPSTQSGEPADAFARSILRPDNYDLFDIVRRRLDARPAEPVECIARDIGVTVDQLCRWVIAFKERKGTKAHYQGKSFAAVRPPSQAIADVWADEDSRKRKRIAQKARDGARAALEAMGASR